MGWNERISQVLDKQVILHAVGQGALGIECRENDVETKNLIASLDHLETRLRCTAERSFMSTLEGGCSVPLGVFTECIPNGSQFELKLIGSVTSVDGKKHVKDSSSCILDGGKDEMVRQAALLGRTVASLLQQQGATEILNEIKANK